MVDAAQGVEAQTVANLHLATEQNLTIIPVLNKIDLPAADVAKCKKQLEEILCIPAEDCIPASAKAGIGIEEILEAIIARVPAPVENPDKLLRCSVFDSLYDTYRGVVSYVRVFSGTVKRGQTRETLRHGQYLRGQGSRRLHPEDERARVSGRRRRRLCHRQHEVRQRGEDRRHHDRQHPPLRRAAARLQGNPADGVFRHLSGRFLRLRSARRWRWASCRSTIPHSPISGKLHRARLWLPLRLPRPAPHGDHPGAPPPRVRHGRDLHLSVRHLSGHHDRRHRAHHRQPDAFPRSTGHPGNPRADRERLHHGARRIHRRHDAARARKTRRCHQHRNHRRHAA